METNQQLLLSSVEYEDDEVVAEEEEALQGRQSRRSNNNNNNASAVVISSNENANGSVVCYNGSVESETANGVEHESAISEDIGEGGKLLHDSVYFDQNDGIWKCRHCNWTYCLRSPLIDINQNLNGYLHMPMNVETFNQQGPCFIFETKGTESINGVFEIKNGSVADADIQSKDLEIQRSVETNDQCVEILDDKGFSDSSLAPLEESHGEQDIKSQSFNNETRLVGDFDLIEETDQEETELDVERVLQEQNTHDLYCPNCNSCITRRVILCRRKRKVRSAHRKLKHYKVDKKNLSELDARYTNPIDVQIRDTVNIHSSGSPALATDDHNINRETEVFRCLSCFSFFIPTGEGFKLFRLFGNSAENENVQNLQETPAINRNWFPSIFATDKKKTTIGQAGNKTLADQKGFVSSIASPSSALLNDLGSASEARKEIADPSKEDDKYLGNAPTSVEGKSENAIEKVGDASNYAIVDTVQQLSSQCSSGTVLCQQKKGPSEALLPSIRFKTGEFAEDASLGAPLGGGNFATSSKFSMPGQSQIEIDKNSKTAMAEEPVDKDKDFSLLGTPFSTQLFLEGGLLKDSALVHHETRKDAMFSSSGYSPTVGTGESAEDASLGPPQDGGNSAVSSKSLMPAASQIEIDKNLKTAMAEQPVNNDKDLSLLGTQWPTQLFSEGGLIKDSALIPRETRKDAIFSSSEGTSVLEKPKIDVGEGAFNAVEKRNSGSDVIVDVETTALEPAASQRLQNSDGPTEAGSLLESGIRTYMSEQQGSGVTVDILKSIVYGGLIESITSLGIVSSAAGAGSATLNILALGLANLIGGLFIIGHNLVELKNDTSGTSSNQMNEQEDRYQETLGRRESFSLQATVAILSFIIFGILPPVIYGFSFRKSDNKDLKLAVVGGASLLCIILLAIGKAHVQRQPKYISTVFYYAIIGAMASGASYIVGDLISKLVEKEGWFEPSSAIIMSVPEIKPAELAWASY